MRFTFFHVVVLLVAAAHVIESAKPLQPYIVMDKPYTEFDSSTGTIQVIAGKKEIKLRCALNKLETLSKKDIMKYVWVETITGQPGYTSTDTIRYSIITIKGNGHYGFKCQVMETMGQFSDYSYPATISVLGAPPLGSHPEVSDYTSTSVDVSWKKPVTTFTITDYDIKISPIYSKETASAVKGDVENPTTHLTNLKPRTIYEVSVRTHIALDGDDAYGPEKIQSFMTKGKQSLMTKDAATDQTCQNQRSLVSIITCLILSICVTF